jgi:hypothetical protein
MISDAYEAASKRVTTGDLNRFVSTLEFDRNMKIYYMTQGSVRPPTFVVFTDKAKDLHFSSERFIINQLRKRFGFEGTPIRIKAKPNRDRAERAAQNARTESIPLACRTTCIFSSADLWICETRLSLMPKMPPISFMVISLV